MASRCTFWPLHPHDSVTVWLAFTDVDEENGAMRVIPGTHKQGLIPLKKSQDASNVLNLETNLLSIDEEDAVTFCMKTGEISIHDDALLHGSKANLSKR